IKSKYMRQFMTSVVEQRKDFTGSFSTHPIEVGWAREAIFFITVEECHGRGALLKAKVQISVDGVYWLDEGTAFDPIDSRGQYFVRVSHFGGWLRLSGEIEGKEGKFNLTIHLVIKE
ncbi:MAG TPA: hypothetical protein VHA52_10720, partial [Candidatus Babeliaceae bacterium]|nr:hypothetical protein [Candidatus Babeliaceae bacterium]